MVFFIVNSPQRLETQIQHGETVIQKRWRCFFISYFFVFYFYYFSGKNNETALRKKKESYRQKWKEEERVYGK